MNNFRLSLASIFVHVVHEVHVVHCLFCPLSIKQSLMILLQNNWNAGYDEQGIKISLQKENSMFGTGELLVILFIVLVLFGGKKLPELARSIGLGLREFKKACNGLDEQGPVEKKGANKAEEQETIIVEVEPKDPPS